MKRMMQRSGMALALLLMPMVVLACGIGEQAPEGYENAPVSHAYEHWRQGERASIPFLFLDVRTPEEYAQGHIEGAKLIPVQELAAHLADVPKDRQVYVYCHSGRRSARAARLLAENGFKNIENVLGGIEAWKAAGYPVVK